MVRDRSVPGNDERLQPRLRAQAFAAMLSANLEYRSAPLRR